MSDLIQPQPDSQSSSESFGSVPNRSEDFGKLPNTAEGFRSVPNASAAFRTIPKVAERTASHTLTVREAARLFETAGVARTERSIVTWCQPNPQGVSRLDAYFDMNDRKWFITPESVERAIAEERAKAARHNDALPNPAEAVTDLPKTSEAPKSSGTAASGEDSEQVSKLEKEVLDLKILNSGKDFLIGQLRSERDGFIEQLIEGSRRIGQLESEVRQLAAPADSSRHTLRNGSEGDGNTRVSE